MRRKIMKIKKLQKALNLSSSATYEEFVDEVLSVYISSKEINATEEDNSPSTHDQMTWGRIKQLQAEGISENGKNIVILKGSDFANEDTYSLGQNYKDFRRELIDSGVIEVTEEGNYRFAVDYPFPSFSTAASVIRGVQLNGLKAFKQKKD